MNDHPNSQRRVTVIPATQAMNPLLPLRQKRVAAYCRVSTAEEEQQSSYEAQCSYYTEKILSNKEWAMAGIFADEGITGTSAQKRPEFLRMIRMCKQGKIDLILTKSISRFARNTVDCLSFIRLLKGMGIGIVFEKDYIKKRLYTTYRRFSCNIVLYIVVFANISNNILWLVACLSLKSAKGYLKILENKRQNFCTEINFRNINTKARITS